MAPTSPLVGYTVKALAFRSKYDAAIIAIHRRVRRGRRGVCAEVLGSTPAVKGLGVRWTFGCAWL